MNSPETTKEIITEYLLDSMKIKGLPNPLNVTLDQFNVWSIVTDFENKTGVNLNDSQIKRCKTVGQLIDMLYSVIILSSKVNIDNLGTNISSKQKYQSTSNSSYSNKGGTSLGYNNRESHKKNTSEESFDTSKITTEVLLEEKNKNALADTDSAKTNDEALFESLTSELEEIENMIMPQIEQLGQQLPELYQGYADAVRETSMLMRQYINFSDKTSRNIAFGAEVGARFLEAWGQYKAAQKHNQMLRRFLTIKQQIAQTNNEKLKEAGARAEKALASNRRLFNKYMSQKFETATLHPGTLDRVRNLNLRALYLYRNSLWLNENCLYLKNEYRNWLAGRQTSGYPQPDLHNVNEKILAELYEGDPFDALEKAADSDRYLTGADISLLSDYHLATIAIKPQLCIIEREKASPCVSKLMRENAAFEDYESATAVLANHVTDSPTIFISIAFFACVIAIVALCIWYVPGSIWLRIIIGVGAFLMCVKIFNRSIKHLEMDHICLGNILKEEIEETLSRKCGRKPKSDIDYEQKNETAAFLGGFVGIK